MLWLLICQQYVYSQGKNIEQEENIHNDIMSHLPSDIFSNGMTDVGEAYKILRDANCWMQMRGGSKLKNFITPSINSLNSSDFVIISGSGPAVTKVRPREGTLKTLGA